MKQGAASATQSGMQQLAQARLLRLKNWDISNEQIAAMAKSGAAQRTLTLRSPASGIVMEKKAVQGMRFMPGVQSVPRFIAASIRQDKKYRHQ